MRGSGLIGLALAAITGLIIADLWKHSKVTSQVIGFGSSTAKLIAG